MGSATSARVTVGCERTDGATVEVLPPGGVGEYANFVSRSVEKPTRPCTVLLQVLVRLNQPSGYKSRI